MEQFRFSQLMTIPPVIAINFSTFHRNILMIDNEIQNEKKKHLLNVMKCIFATSLKQCAISALFFCCRISPPCLPTIPTVI